VIGKTKERDKTIEETLPRQDVDVEPSRRRGPAAAELVWRGRRAPRRAATRGRGRERHESKGRNPHYHQGLRRPSRRPETPATTTRASAITGARQEHLWERAERRDGREATGRVLPGNAERAWAIADGGAVGRRNEEDEIAPPDPEDIAQLI
jgi:hypothetical protein